MRKAREAFNKRSRGSRARDRMSRAPIETDYEVWVDNQRGLDFPGVDTPRDDPRQAFLDARFGEGGDDAVLDRRESDKWMGSALLGNIAEDTKMPEGTAGRARDALRF
jgi:hypothetical protein